jgi:hypothetical protein
MSSCGMAYHESAMVGAGRLDDHTAIAGPALVSLRFGAEWIELAITNTSEDALEIDWNAIELGEAYGGIHLLRDMALLRTDAGIRHVTRPAYESASLLDPVHVRRAAPPVGSSVQVIRAGATSMAMLYVAEHVAAGERRPGPVFCHSGLLHLARPHEVWISIPVRRGAHADTLRVSATVAS